MTWKSQETSLAPLCVFKELFLFLFPTNTSLLLSKRKRFFFKTRLRSRDSLTSSIPCVRKLHQILGWSPERGFIVMDDFPTTACGLQHPGPTRDLKRYSTINARVGIAENKKIRFYNRQLCARVWQTDHSLLALLLDREPLLHVPSNVFSSGEAKKIACNSIGPGLGLAGFTV